MNAALLIPVPGWMGWQEILLVLAVLLLLFGATRIPDLARSLGKGVNEFKKGLQGTESDTPKKIKEEEQKALEDKQKEGEEE